MQCAYRFRSEFRHSASKRKIRPVNHLVEWSRPWLKQLPPDLFRSSSVSLLQTVCSAVPFVMVKRLHQSQYFLDICIATCWCGPGLVQAGWAGLDRWAGWVFCWNGSERPVARRFQRLPGYWRGCRRSWQKSHTRGHKNRFLPFITTENLLTRGVRAATPCIPLDWDTGR